MPIDNATTAMISPPSPPSPPYHPHNPHKRQRLLSSPSPRPHDPSFSGLALDRLASRTKLRTTWEDLIAKYSSIPDDAADEIDLETGEVVVDHGHLKSLADSVLWAADSDPDDDDNSPPPPNRKVEGSVARDVSPKVDAKGDPGLPSEEEIMKQFGEDYGREILQYLQQRQTSGKGSRGEDMWKPPEDEEAVFARASEIWAVYRAKRAAVRAPAHGDNEEEGREFDKASFERAVFGICSENTFEEIVFGQIFGMSQEKENVGGEVDAKGAIEEEDLTADGRALFKSENDVANATSGLDDEDGQKRDVLDAKRAFEMAVFGQIVSDPEQVDDGYDSDDVIEIPGFEPKRPRAEGIEIPSLQELHLIVREPISEDNTKSLETHDIDHKDLTQLFYPLHPIAPSSPRPVSTPATPTAPTNPERPTTAPRQREIIDLTTPSPIKPRAPLTNHARKKSTSRSPRSRKRSTSQSPSRRRSSSSLRRSVVSGLVDASDQEDNFFPSLCLRTDPVGPLRGRTSNVIRIESDDDLDGTERDLGSEDGVERAVDAGDTLGRCGEVGYRCSKAFCFQCVA